MTSSFPPFFLLQLTCFDCTHVQSKVISKKFDMGGLGVVSTGASFVATTPIYSRMLVISRDVNKWFNLGGRRRTKFQL